VFLLMLTVFALNYREAEQQQVVSRAELEAAKEEARLQADRAEHLRNLLKEAAAQFAAEY
jgi:hypothetical protein